MNVTLTTPALGSCLPWPPGVWRSCSKWFGGECGRAFLPSPPPAATDLPPDKTYSINQTSRMTYTNALHPPAKKERDAAINPKV